MSSIESFWDAPKPHLQNVAITQILVYEDKYSFYKIISSNADCKMCQIFHGVVLLLSVGLLVVVGRGAMVHTVRVSNQIC